MNRTIVKNARLAGHPPDELFCIEVADGEISEIAHWIQGEDAVDIEGATVLPGFIDIHNHGAVGVDVNEADSDGLIRIGRFLLDRGVTSWVPTIVPDSQQAYGKIIDAVREVRASDVSDIADIVGIHYEGIFSNKKVCGALRPDFFREYRRGDLEKLPSIEGIPHIFTFAPEVDGGIELAEDLVKKGWIPSIGHTAASFPDLEKAYSKGVRQITHLFNAMSGIHHRDLGVAGWAMAKEDVCCELIADGVHVADEILGMTLRAKGGEGLMLVSDSIAPTGLGDGEYEIWNDRITVKDKRTENRRGSIAGSVIALSDAAERMMKLGASADDLKKFTSSNQATRLGLHDRGDIAIGKRADLVALDSQGQICLVTKSGAVIRPAV